MQYKIFPVLCLLLIQPAVLADSVSMRDYNLLTNGMSEAEILYRLGPYDHETIAHDYYQNIMHKTWFYIPTQSEVSNRQWITEIKFNSQGVVTQLNRYRVRPR